jgi:hypothetical protein
MTNEPQKPPRNRDQELPPRKGEAIESTVPSERGKGERDPNGPVPEEETYEREPLDHRT